MRVWQLGTGRSIRQPSASPNTDPDDAREVDIARITIRSTLSGTTCVTARRVGSRIRYRIVDGYEGKSLSYARERSSSRAWSLRQLVDFLPRGWDLRAMLWVNFDLDRDDPEKIKRILSITTGDF